MMFHGRFPTISHNLSKLNHGFQARRDARPKAGGRNHGGENQVTRRPGGG